MKLFKFLVPLVLFFLSLGICNAAAADKVQPYPVVRIFSPPAPIVIDVYITYAPTNPQAGKREISPAPAKPYNYDRDIRKDIFIKAHLAARLKE